ncbi:MAG: putative signal transducing protein [Desulfitobacteriaceae bacterium]
MSQAEFVYLCGVPRDPEADIIIGLLESQGIPVSKLYPESGQFLKTAFGLTSGVDLYVPKEHLAAAKQLLETASPDLEEEPQEPQEPQESQESQEVPPLTVENSSSNLNQWIIIIIIILLSLVLFANNYKYLLGP